MTPTTITRRFQFCAGHRLVRHEGKCAHLHGHNYVAHVTCSADELDTCGRVIDFSVVKHVVGAWIDARWDHKLVLNIEDEQAVNAARALGDPVYLMRSNPTAENMALELLQAAAALLEEQHNIRVVSVRLWETENCDAEVHA